MNDVAFAGYADDNTPSFVGEGLSDIILKFKNASKILFKWLNGNQMKANPNKCHFFVALAKKISIMIENEQIGSSYCEKLLGVLLT